MIYNHPIGKDYKLYVSDIYHGEKHLDVPLEVSPGTEVDGSMVIGSVGLFSPAYQLGILG